MSEKTPQLDLLMKDPTLDGHEYFNVKTMMNDNWEKIDKFAGEAKASIENLEDRLNTKAEEEVVLNGGVQIVRAARSAPFSLKGLKGRTLVNLLGRMGKGDSVAGWGIPIQATLSIDTANSAEGSSSFKVVSTATSGESFVGPSFDHYIPVTAGNYYLVVGMIKVITGSAWLRPVTLVDNTSNASATGDYGDLVDKITSINKFVTVQFKFKAPANSKYMIVRQQVSAGGSAYFKAIRVHEVSADEFAALDGMKTDQIAAGYPYVDGVMPTRNPYAIRYGENLLPPFYEWSAKEGSPVLIDDKSVSVTSADKFIHTVTPVIPGQTYTVSAHSSATTGRIVVNNSPETTILAEVSGSGAISVTFTVPAGITAIVIRLLATTTTAITISNPMLNIGSEALPYVPREDAILALQTDLYADPVTGANADSVFENGGQYFKAKKWRRLILDGSLAWVYGDAVSAGLKQVKVIGLVSGGVAASGIATKYDGKIIPQGSTGSTADTNAVTAVGDFYISIPNADSGWGDKYTPSSDEIKAYFLGWKMYDANTYTPEQAQTGGVTYSGTGSKYWVHRVGAATYTQTLPTTSYAEWTPYELVYQLATPAVEPISSEGQLMFNEGSNQVEVDTGIVLREAVKLDDRDPKYVYINSINSGTRFKYRSGKLLAVYKNSINDFNWYKGTSVYNNEFYAYGQISRANFDPNAAYSATYLMLATSPVQPIIGTYARNERSLLKDLVVSVTQQEIRLAAVENKNAEKDNPLVWVRPTLLNGWIGGTTMYTKLENGLVVLRGVIQNGTTTAGTPIFYLPKGYRPSQSMEIRARSYNGSGDSSNSTIIIDPNGRVILQNIVYSTMWFDGISFVAEQ